MIRITCLLLGLAISLSGNAAGTDGQSAGDEPALVSYQQMSLSIARRAADAAIRSCRQRGFQVSVAVVDRAGLLQAFVRDRFAGPHTIEVAQDKAWTAASFRTPTIELGKATAPASAESGIRMVRRVMVNGGGLPISAAGSLVGAIGVSGAPGGAADEACALAGLDAIRDDLEF